MFFYLTKNNIWFKLSIVLQFLKSTLLGDETDVKAKILLFFQEYY